MSEKEFSNKDLFFHPITTIEPITPAQRTRNTVTQIFRSNPAGLTREEALAWATRCSYQVVADQRRQQGQPETAERFKAYSRAVSHRDAYKSAVDKLHQHTASSTTTQES